MESTDKDFAIEIKQERDYHDDGEEIEDFHGGPPNTRHEQIQELRLGSQVNNTQTEASPKPNSMEIEQTQDDNEDAISSQEEPALAFGPEATNKQKGTEESPHSSRTPFDNRGKTVAQVLDYASSGCSRCIMGFDNEDSLKRHLQTHNAGLTIKCHVCKKTFGTCKQLQNHLVTHTVDKTCMICYKPFPDKNQLNKHLLTHIGKKPFKCETCLKWFSLKSSLKTHLLKHTGEKSFLCSFCERCFLLRSNLEEHLQSTHNVVLKDESDLSKWENEKVGSNHLSSVIKAKVIEAEDNRETHDIFPEPSEYSDEDFLKRLSGSVTIERNKTFSSSNQLKEHLVTHIMDRVNTCEFCHKSFLSLRQLKTHLRIHAGDRPFKCDHCQKCFSHKCSLKYHLLTHPDDEPFLCSFCSQSFVQRSFLKQHQIEQHSAVINEGSNINKWDSTKRVGLSDSVPCIIKAEVLDAEECEEILDESFSPSDTRTETRDQVIGFSETQSVSVPMVCSFCKKTFGSSDGLKEHLVTHTSEREKVCEICHKSFLRTGNLKAHLRTHTGEKPFSCSTCGKNFTAKGILTVHERTHSGVKPFKCEICFKSYTQMRNLKLHLRFHSDDNG